MGELEQPTALLKKLLAIMKDCAYIQRDRKNEHFKFTYASERAIKEKLHEALVTHGVLLKVSQSEIAERLSVSGKETITTIKHVYEFIDVETGQREAGEFYGSGSDGADKGVYKATTGAIKYILTTMFLIPTGDDPEEAPKSAATKPTTKPAATTTSQASGVINEAQRKRLYAIAGESGKPHDVVKHILAGLQFASSKDVTIDKYDAVVAAIQEPLKVKDIGNAELPDPFEVPQGFYVSKGGKLYGPNEELTAMVEMK